MHDIFEHLESLTMDTADGLVANPDQQDELDEIFRFEGRVVTVSQRLAEPTRQFAQQGRRISGIGRGSRRA